MHQPIFISGRVQPPILADVEISVFMLRSRDKGGGEHTTTTTAEPDIPTAPQSDSGLSVAAGKDSGNESLEHYKVLPPYRFKLRNKCLPFVRKETDILYQIQKRMRNKWLDYYFAYSANLASHTFYVLMLPISMWFGSAVLARDLVFVLGIGIYLTGNLKDFLCLPRPRSPPLHRITLSSYTALEYGFPSSHSANATAVTLVLVRKLLLMELDYNTKVYAMIATAVYYFSLIFGRIYCGMHGFLDVLMGSFIGLSLFLFRVYFGQQLDDYFVLDVDGNFGNFTPLIIISFYLFLIHIHFEPVDNCPCFDDSVAFIGVLIGLDLSHWLAYKTLYFIRASENKVISPIIISYDYEQIGLVKTIIRVVLGITLVVTWQTLSKKVVYTILPPIYKTIGVYLPRRNYQPTAYSNKSNKHIRRTSLSNFVAEDLNFKPEDIKLQDEIGVQTDIDYYEMINYKEKEANKFAKVFKPRYDVEIIGRLIIYAGISVMSVWGFAVMTAGLGLD